MAIVITDAARTATFFRIEDKSITDVGHDLQPGTVKRRRIAQIFKQWATSPQKMVFRLWVAIQNCNAVAKINNRTFHLLLCNHVETKLNYNVRALISSHQSRTLPETKWWYVVSGARWCLFLEFCHQIDYTLLFDVVGMPNTRSKTMFLKLFNSEKFAWIAFGDVLPCRWSFKLLRIHRRLEDETKPIRVQLKSSYAGGGRSFTTAAYIRMQ